MNLSQSDLLHQPLLFKEGNFTGNIWGGTWIPRFKGLKVHPPRVGESWEFSDLPLRPNFLKGQKGRALSLREFLSLSPGKLLGASVIRQFGPRAPFLLKFIDAKDNLSLQVHPVGRGKKVSGKSEAWVILDVAPGAASGFIYLGFDPDKARRFKDAGRFQAAFRRAIGRVQRIGPTREKRLLEKAASEILPYVNKIRVRPGDVFRVPSGTIHSIGRGVRLFEIQEPCDVTYRIWDWNRPDPLHSTRRKLRLRKLHLKEALSVLNFQPLPKNHYKLTWNQVGTLCREVWEGCLLRDPVGRFSAHLIEARFPASVYEKETRGVLQVLTVIRGRVRVSTSPDGGAPFSAGCVVRRGQTVLIPAAAARYRLQALSARMQIIRSTVDV
ncbi:MAG: class I mannose-6-phosphate isomerase [Elusimicrobia bacterium]|nr:class I mannose-6-phosphate isomerase [Candidatus Obscuribacterium magneticum]